MNKSLKLLYLSQSLNLLADNLLIPLFALLVLSVGGGARIAGQLWAIQFFVAAVVGFGLTRIEDKPRLNIRLLTLNYLVKGMLWSVLIWKQSIDLLVVVQAILGVCSAVGGPALNSLIAEHMDDKKHISNWSYLDAISHLLVGMSSLVAGYVVSSLGFSYVFLLMALIEFGVVGVLVWGSRMLRG